MAKRKRHFAHLSEETLLSEPYKKMRPHSRLLYAYMLAKRAGNDSWFDYPYEDIRKDTRYQYRTIKRAIDELAQAGFIEYKRGGLERNDNSYYVPSPD